MPGAVTGASRVTEGRRAVTSVAASSLVVVRDGPPADPVAAGVDEIGPAPPWLSRTRPSSGSTTQSDTARRRFPRCPWDIAPSRPKVDPDRNRLSVRRPPALASGGTNRPGYGL